MIYFTSDLHFNHDREFIWGPRGFKSVEDMNNAIVNNWNSVVKEDDVVYILGDLMLGKNYLKGIELINSLNGGKYIILGNHDTEGRVGHYSWLIDKLCGIDYATIFKQDGYTFYLSHYPTITGSLENGNLKEMICNLFGHTHSKDMFYDDRPYMYNVSLDAHKCKPVSIDEIIKDMNDKVEECKSYL